jgi:glutaredoxin
MKIVYYKSLVCPRCIPTNRLIAQLQREHPEIEVEQVELLTHLSRARRDGVMTLPTLIVGERRFTRAPRLEELLAALELERALPLPAAA